MYHVGVDNAVEQVLSNPAEITVDRAQRTLDLYASWLLTGLRKRKEKEFSSRWDVPTADTGGNATQRSRYHQQWDATYIAPALGLVVVNLRVVVVEVSDGN